jgi:hypothetical protein
MQAKSATARSTSAEHRPGARTELETNDEARQFIEQHGLEDAVKTASRLAGDIYPGRKIVIEVDDEGDLLLRVKLLRDELDRKRWRRLVSAFNSSVSPEVTSKVVLLESLAS